MYRRLLLFIALILSVVLVGCSANDPLTDGLYNADGFYAVDGGHLSRTDATGTGGGYWHEYNMGAINLNPGASGAAQIAPNASSLGGYRLDNITEYILFDTHVESDWDAVGNGIVEIDFEVNVDNTGGLVTDTVKFQLECWHKIPGELVNTVYSLEGNTVVGQSDQHELFKQTIAIANMREGEIIAFRLNLNTITGDVANVIVNYIEFKYPVYYPSMEVD